MVYVTEVCTHVLCFNLGTTVYVTRMSTCMFCFNPITMVFITGVCIYMPCSSPGTFTAAYCVYCYPQSANLFQCICGVGCFPVKWTLSHLSEHLLNPDIYNPSFLNPNLPNTDLNSNHRVSVCFPCHKTWCGLMKCNEVLIKQIWYT